MAFFPYEHDPRFSPLLRSIGVRHDRDGVLVENGVLIASFGFFNLKTALSNIRSAEVTGPYRWYKARGPHVSVADHGATFGTSARRRVLVRFVKPIDRVVGPWSHPNLTLTVADPDALVTTLQGGS